MDEDIKTMSRARLIKEVLKLRKGIRKHRDSSGHALCWYHPKLWGLLPEKTDPKILLPSWDKFMEGCVKYRRSLDKELPKAKITNAKFKAK